MKTSLTLLISALAVFGLSSCEDNEQKKKEEAAQNIINQQRETTRENLRKIKESGKDSEDPEKPKWELK